MVSLSRSVRISAPGASSVKRDSSDVAEVVLHPAILERLHPQRVRQVHAGTRRLKGVDRPAPAVGRLEDHLGILTAARDHPIQTLDIIEDPDRLQHFPRLGRPDDHRASPVKIDTDELLPCAL